MQRHRALPRDDERGAARGRALRRPQDHDLDVDRVVQLDVDGEFDDAVEHDVHDATDHDDAADHHHEHVDDEHVDDDHRADHDDDRADDHRVDDREDQEHDHPDHDNHLHHADDLVHNRAVHDHDPSGAADRWDPGGGGHPDARPEEAARRAR
jgi:hypothetical protein